MKKTFRIHATYETFVHLDVEADSKEEALRIAYESDGSDWVTNDYGDWDIDEKRVFTK